MTTDASTPFDGIDPADVTVDDVDESTIKEALSSRSPLEQQRAVEICESLAAENVDHVRPYLDELATLVADDNAVISLNAIQALDHVAEAEPTALDGRLADLVSVMDSELVDVQLTGATLLGRVVVEHPDMVAPDTQALVEAIRDTEPDPNPTDLSDVVDDRVTRETIQEHEEGERKRRMAGRRTLVNVVVAITETEPEAAFDAVEGLVSLLDDVDATVVGGAIDALGELAIADPSVVAPVRDDLVDCLDHHDSSVRARAIRALGHLGDDAAVPALRSVAEDDEDDDVQKLAAETADFLEREA